MSISFIKKILFSCTFLLASTVLCGELHPQYIKSGSVWYTGSSYGLNASNDQIVGKFSSKYHRTYQYYTLPDYTNISITGAEYSIHYYFYPEDDFSVNIVHLKFDPDLVGQSGMSDDLYNKFTYQLSLNTIDQFTTNGSEIYNKVFDENDDFCEDLNWSLSSGWIGIGIYGTNVTNNDENFWVDPQDASHQYLTIYWETDFMTNTGSITTNEIWDGTNTLIGDVIIPTGSKLTIGNDCIVNLNGHSIISTGGTISKSSGVTMNGLRATLRANGVLRGFCGRIQHAATFAGETNEIILENGNFNENVTIYNKGNLAISGSPYYNHFGTLTVESCDVFQASGFGAKRVYINYGSYLILLNLYIDGINQSTDGLSLFNCDTYDMDYLTSIYSSQGIVCTNGTDADIEHSHLEFNNTGLYSYNGSNVNISNSNFCGTALDLRTYNFSSIAANTCCFDGGTPSTWGSNISHYWDQSCSLSKSARQTVNNNDETSIIETNGSDFKKINSSYFAINKGLTHALKENTDFNKDAFCADYDKVVTDFKEFIRNHPDSPLARIALTATAKSYRRIDNLRGKSDLKGMKDFLNDIIENTEYPALKQQAEMLMIDYYRLTNDFTGAIKAADNAMEKYEEDADYVCGALYGKGLMQAYNLNKPQEAADCFAQIVQDYPDNLMCEMAKNELRILGYDKDQFEEENASLANQEEFEVNSFPNPFNPTTTIQYALPQDVHVKIEVFNTQGQRIKTLIDNLQTAGAHQVTFDGSNLASGVYYYRFSVGSFNKAKRILLLK